jgi:hypothetical protein
MYVSCLYFSFEEIIEFMCLCKWKGCKHLSSVWNISCLLHLLKWGEEKDLPHLREFPYLMQVLFFCARRWNSLLLKVWLLLASSMTTLETLVEYKLPLEWIECVSSVRDARHCCFAKLVLSFGMAFRIHSASALAFPGKPSSSLKKEFPHGSKDETQCSSISVALW